LYYNRSGGLALIATKLQEATISSIRSDLGVLPMHNCRLSSLNPAVISVVKLGDDQPAAALIQKVGLT